MTALPTPTLRPVELDFSTRKPKRVREYHYEIGPAADSNGTRVLAVAFRHNSDKTFTTYVIEKTLQADGTETYWPMDGKHFLGWAAPRYSAKALEEYARRRLAELPALLDALPKLRAAFTPLLGEPVTVEGHAPVVTVSDKYAHLSCYSCSCGQMESFAGSTAHDHQRARFDAHLAAVAPQAQDGSTIPLSAEQAVEIAVVVNIGGPDDDTGSVGVADWVPADHVAELPSYDGNDVRYLVSVPAGQTPNDVNDAMDAFLGEYDLPDGYENLGALVDPTGSVVEPDPFLTPTFYDPIGRKPASEQERLTVFADEQGREGLLVFTGGRRTGFTPCGDGAVRFGYLKDDGTEADMRETEYVWIDPVKLTATRFLPESPPAPQAEPVSYALTAPAAAYDFLTG